MRSHKSALLDYPAAIHEGFQSIPLRTDVSWIYVAKKKSLILSVSASLFHLSSVCQFNQFKVLIGM